MGCGSRGRGRCLLLFPMRRRSIKGEGPYVGADIFGLTVCEALCSFHASATSLLKSRAHMAQFVPLYRQEGVVVVTEPTWRSLYRTADWGLGPGHGA